jgi:voltage-gated potassium channel
MARLHQHWRSPLYQLKIVFLLLASLVAVGVLFYGEFLHLLPREALLQIVLTLSTLGGEAKAGILQDPLAQWFHIFFILAILIVVLWGLSLLIEATVRGELLYFWGARRMDQRIAALKGHFIVCGFGRMGQEIARQLDRSHQPFVVLEHNPAQATNLEAAGYLYLTGDAREDDQLLKAGIQRAKGLVAVARTDEENVYITLSARVLNPELFIVTRSSQPSSEAKLQRAGANRVFSPYVVGGRRMAQSILAPSVVEFLDAVVHGEQVELVLEEVTVGKQAKFCGRTIAGDSRESDVECLGVHLLGISTPDGRMIMKDLMSHELEEGDTLILLGEPSAVQYAIKQLTGEERKLKRGSGILES